MNPCGPLLVTFYSSARKRAPWRQTIVFPVTMERKTGLYLSCFLKFQTICSSPGAEGIWFPESLKNYIRWSQYDMSHALSALSDWQTNPCHGRKCASMMCQEVHGMMHGVTNYSCCKESDCVSTRMRQVRFTC